MDPVAYQELTGIVKNTASAPVEPETEITSLKQQSNAVTIIIRVWKQYLLRKTFRWLVHSLYRAERSMTEEVLKRLAPNEAILLRDPSTQARVRFRFGGTTFPPKVMYKIFTKGSNVHYFSGLRMILPGSRAAEDSCSVMGSRKYQEQVYFEEQQTKGFRIGRSYEVTDKMEFVQYMNSLDQRAPHLGGRNNGWRELSIPQASQQAVHYDTRKNGVRRQNRPNVKRTVKKSKKSTIQISSGNSNITEQIPDIEEDFGVLFQWTNHLSMDHFDDYVLI